MEKKNILNIFYLCLLADIRELWTRECVLKWLKYELENLTGTSDKYFRPKGFGWENKFCNPGPNSKKKH